MKHIVCITALSLLAVGMTACSKPTGDTPTTSNTTPHTTSKSTVSTAPAAVAVRSQMAASVSPPATSRATTPDAHVSRTSLDWAGSYRGTPVCANCAKVEFLLELRDGDKYTLTYTDPATQKAVKYEGDFKWDETGNSIGAQIDGYNYVYRVGENRLIRQATDAPADAAIVAPLEYKKSP